MASEKKKKVWASAADSVGWSISQVQSYQVHRVNILNPHLPIWPLPIRKVVFGPHNYFLFYFSIIQKLAGEATHWRFPLRL